MTGDDLISRAAACDEIGKMIHEYREKDDHDLADALILTRRYVLKRLPTVDAIPMDWMNAQIRGYASALKSTELKALIVVKGLWEKDQEAKS